MNDGGDADLTARNVLPIRSGGERRDKGHRQFTSRGEESAGSRGARGIAGVTASHGRAACVSASIAREEHPSGPQAFREFAIDLAQAIEARLLAHRTHHASCERPLLEDHFDRVAKRG